jgi:hypothetical protein
MAFVQQDGDVAPPVTPYRARAPARASPERTGAHHHRESSARIHRRALARYRGARVQRWRARWSGSGTRTAPVIAPGDSFVAAFTPPRSGRSSITRTRTSYSRSDSGSTAACSSWTRPGTILRTSASSFSAVTGPESGPRGSTVARCPDTIRLTAGEIYRLRLIHIVPDWNVKIALIAGR